MIFRRRPSDDEMREELEAHIAMRAEHDGVDEAAARRAGQDTAVSSTSASASTAAVHDSGSSARTS